MIYKITIETRKQGRYAENNYLRLIGGSNTLDKCERADAINYRNNQGIRRCIKELESYGARVEVEP